MRRTRNKMEAVFYSFTDTEKTLKVTPVFAVLKQPQTVQNVISFCCPKVKLLARLVSYSNRVNLIEILKHLKHLLLTLHGS